jgi:DNA transposition AAA+ family ATPase
MQQTLTQTSIPELDPEIEQLPIAHKEIIRYWHAIATERKLSLSQVEKITDVSTSTLSRLFRNAYKAGLETVCLKLIAVRKSYEEGGHIDRQEFAETAVANLLFKVCDRTRALSNVALVWGDKGIGKTRALNEYALKNSSSKTIYMRCRASVTFHQFVRTLGNACNVQTANAFDLREKIIEFFSNGQKLLIVDELHQIFLTMRRDVAIRCAEYLREVFDVAGCGLVLVGTNVLEREFKNGRDREALSQLLDRGTLQVQLPNKPSLKDLSKLVAHYQLELPDKESSDYRLIMDIIAAHGLRKFCISLKDGAARAAKNQEVYAWQHFSAAYDIVQKIAK